MKYVITGSLGNVSKPLTEKLVASGHDVTVISSKNEKKAQIESLGAKAAIGSVEDGDFLSKTFMGADAVYTMVPPHFATSNWKQYIAGIGENLAGAIKASGVKFVVNLSSLGAHMPEGCGPVSGLCIVEGFLNNLDGVNVLSLRPGFFYPNLLSNVGMIRHMGIAGGNYGENVLMVFSDPADIAEVAARELQNLSFRGKGTLYLASDERTTNEVAEVLGYAIGKPGLRWVNFSDEDTLGGMLQNGVPEEVAKNYTEMGAAMRSGEMGIDYLNNRPRVFGKTKLEDFAQVFAADYNQS